MYGILKDGNQNDGHTLSQLACLFAAPIAVTSKRTNFSSDSLSLKRLSRSSLAQRWEIETTIAQSNFGIDFFINNILNDISTEVFVRMPQPIQKFRLATGAGRGAQTVSIDVLQPGGGDQLIIDGSNANILLSQYGTSIEEYPTDSPIRVSNTSFAIANGTASVSGVAAGSTSVAITLAVDSQLFVGSFIQFSGHQKVYLVHNITGVSYNTIYADIFPPLKSLVTNTDVVSLGVNVTMPVTYDTDSIVGMRYSDGIVSDPGRIKLVESL